MPPRAIAPSKEERGCKVPKMTRDKAIELLTFLRDGEPRELTEDDKIALTLAIKALLIQALEEK